MLGNVAGSAITAYDIKTHNSYALNTQQSDGLWNRVRVWSMNNIELPVMGFIDKYGSPGYGVDATIDFAENVIDTTVDYIVGDTKTETMYDYQSPYTEDLYFTMTSPTLIHSILTTI